MTNKKILISIIVVLIVVVGVVAFAQQLSFENSTQWIGRDIVDVYGDGRIFEYNLYRAININDAVILDILNNFWKNDTLTHGASLVLNELFIDENNTELANGVKQMMIHNNANISTNLHFETLLPGLAIMYFTINFTIDFETYSLWQTFNLVRPWQ